MAYRKPTTDTGYITESGDVALNNPTSGQVLGYDAATKKWQNQTITPTSNIVLYDDTNAVWPARPTFAAAVIYVGPTQPSDMQKGDIWITTS